MAITYFQKNGVKKAQEHFWQLPMIMAGVNRLKTKTMTGFQGVSVYDVAVFLWKEVSMTSVSMRANAVAFSFFLSLFPSLILLISLIPYLPIEKSKVIKEIGLAINEIMPNNAGKVVVQTIKDFLSHRRSDVLSLGFLLAIFFSSNGMMALMLGFERSYGAFKRRNGLQKRLWAINLTFMLGILMVISVTLVILGNQLFKWLYSYVKLGIALSIILTILRWLVVIFLFYFGIALIYRFGVATRRRLHFFSPGALVATILSLLTSLGFSFYVDNFGNYNKLYGSIGTFIVIMLWMQLNATILLLGFELNIAIVMNRYRMTHSQISGLSNIHDLPPNVRGTPPESPRTMYQKIMGLN